METLSAQTHSEPDRRPPLWWRIWKKCARLPRSGAAQFFVLFVGFVLVGTLVVFVLEGWQEGSRFGDFFQAFWFTVVTITTVGYGDMSPSTPPAQAWAMLEMLVGIGLVGIITGNVASLLVERNRKRALGLVALVGVSGHTIICGWKQDMRAILVGILQANPKLSAGDLVLVNGQNPADVGELKRESRLRELQFVSGSHTDPNVLVMANVGAAQRVIILAEDASQADRDAADSRTVLAATTVETLNREVYTCTELVQPHFKRYLSHAQVEEVVLGEQNARALLVAASLGDGLGNVVTRFLPENGSRLRVFPLPAEARGRPYGEMVDLFRGRGLLSIGLLENTGNLHERKSEKLRSALKLDGYGPAVASLLEVGRLGSNVPRLAPPPELVVGDQTRALAILPPPQGQAAEERNFRLEQTPPSDSATGEHLAICGWKRDMGDLLKAVIGLHQREGRPLTRITVVSAMPDAEAGAIADDPDLGVVELAPGEPTDPAVLERAGVEQAHRFLLLSVAGAERSGQAADARNVMTAIAVNGLNPRAYKCVELLNPSFSEHLKMAEVEEIVLTQRYQELMLVQASLGTGLSHAINELLRYGGPAMRVRGFAPAPPGTVFEEHARLLALQGETLIGVVDHAGNQHTRKQEILYEAQVQPRIRGAIDHLLSLKTVVSNQPVLNPGADFIPGSHTRAVVISTAAKGANHG